MSEQAESNVVEFTELKFPVIEYGVTEAALAELRERFKEPDASTEEGYEHCKDGCRELTSLRTALETRRKDLKAPALDWGRKVDKLAKDLIRDIKAIEGPVRSEKERVDEIKQAEARELAQLEQKRIDAIKANIEKISATAREQNPSDKASDYQQHISWLTELAITEEVFGELVDDAKTARDAALYKLNQWHEQTVQREADDARRADERAALDRQREEQDARAEKLREENERIENEKREAKEREAAAEKAEQKRKDDAAEAEAATKKAEDEKADQEQRDKDEAEERRVAAINDRLSEIASFGQHANDSAALKDAIVSLENRQLSESDFAEHYQKAIHVQSIRLDALRALLADVEKLEERQRKDDEARLPDREKLIRWCEQLEAIPEPEVLNDKAQKLLKRYAGELTKFTGKLRSDIGKL